MPLLGDKKSFHGAVMSFFLEYAGELCIFVLREEKTVPYKINLLTPDRAVRKHVIFLFFLCAHIYCCELRCLAKFPFFFLFERTSRGRPKLTWVEAIKGDLKGWNIPKDLALDRSAWKTAIHVPEP